MSGLVDHDPKLVGVRKQIPAGGTVRLDRADQLAFRLDPQVQASFVEAAGPRDPQSHPLFGRRAFRLDPRLQ